jgi:uncharacterized membrane protein YidH (DUF202 family)
MIARSKIIEKSLRCFDWGMASLIPALGIVCAPFALVNFRFAIVEIEDRWNPARRHLYAGVILALLSLLAHAVIGVVVYLRVMRAVDE